MSSRTKAVLAFCLSLSLLSALPALAGEKQTKFPDSATYVLHSNPKFAVTVGENKELVVCKAKLVVKAGEPFITERGKRRVQFQVVDWEAIGTSKLLGGELRFKMIPGASKGDLNFVESYEVVAENSQDFPARAQFELIYTLKTPFGTVARMQGVASGTIESFPPQPGAQFKMQKGNSAELMAQLMPAPLYSMSAAGEVKAQPVTIEPEECRDVAPPDPTLITS
jgi:hypothetical protein